MPNSARPIDILLVEDDPAHSELTEMAFISSGLPSRIHSVPGGAEAIDFLKRRGDYAGVPRPDVILLDLYMPGMDGKDVLDIIKSDAELRTIPVVLLSASEEGQQVIRSYKLRAGCFIRKPEDFTRFLDVVKAVENFWINVTNQPSSDGGRAA